MRRRRALLVAWMLDLPEPPAPRGASRPRHRAPPVRGRILAARGAEARIDALTKLKGLLDAGVLTRRQFADERDRLLGG